MLTNKNFSTEVPLTPSGLTPSVTALAANRKSQGPDSREFVLAGGQIRTTASGKDAALFELNLNSVDDLDPETRSKLVLEAAGANLRAGICFLEKQCDGLRRISQKLSDAARLWRMSRIPDVGDRQLTALQEEFHEAREEVQAIKQAADGSTPLFSDGQVSPIRLHHPFRDDWQLLLIDRCDLGSPAMTTFFHGKIYGDAPGFHLDLETIEKVAKSIRMSMATNELQTKLLCSCLSGVMQRLSNHDEPLSVQCAPPCELPQTATLFRSFN